MELLLSRPVVVALAILGAVLSTAASILEAKGILGPRGGKVVNYTGYAAMALSMALFAFAGLRGVAA
ncbi:MAG TPA: hypothetical protein VN967_02105 [Burkholderiales bacterium]|nr:hypothetical protein [Burkholderiales bacterium]